MEEYIDSIIRVGKILIGSIMVVFGDMTTALLFIIS